MKLTTVFFPGPVEGAYRKAIISKDEIEYFKQLGAATRPEDVSEKAEVKAEQAPDADKGWGKYGSIDWHKNQILAMQSKREIVGYIKKLTGIKMMLKKKDSIDAIRTRAMTNIRRAKNGSESQ